MDSQMHQKLDELRSKLNRQRAQAPLVPPALSSLKTSSTSTRLGPSEAPALHRLEKKARGQQAIATPPPTDEGRLGEGQKKVAEDRQAAGLEREPAGASPLDEGRPATLSHATSGAAGLAASSPNRPSASSSSPAASGPHAPAPLSRHSPPSPPSSASASEIASSASPGRFAAPLPPSKASARRIVLLEGRKKSTAALLTEGLPLRPGVASVPSSSQQLPACNQRPADPSPSSAAASASRQKAAGEDGRGSVSRALVEELQQWHSRLSENVEKQLEELHMRARTHYLPSHASTDAVGTASTPRDSDCATRGCSDDCGGATAGERRAEEEDGLRGDGAEKREVSGRRAGDLTGMAVAADGCRAASAASTSSPVSPRLSPTPESSREDGVERSRAPRGAEGEPGDASKSPGSTHFHRYRGLKNPHLREMKPSPFSTEDAAGATASAASGGCPPAAGSRQSPQSRDNERASQGSRGYYSRHSEEGVSSSRFGATDDGLSLKRERLEDRDEDDERVSRAPDRRRERSRSRECHGRRHQELTHARDARRGSSPDTKRETPGHVRRSAEDDAGGRDCVRREEEARARRPPRGRERSEGEREKDASSQAVSASSSGRRRSEERDRDISSSRGIAGARHEKRPRRGEDFRERRDRGRVGETAPGDRAQSEGSSDDREERRRRAGACSGGSGAADRGVARHDGGRRHTPRSSEERRSVSRSASPITRENSVEPDAGNDRRDRGGDMRNGRRGPQRDAHRDGAREGLSPPSRNGSAPRRGDTSRDRDRDRDRERPDARESCGERREEDRQRDEGRHPLRARATSGDSVDRERPSEGATNAVRGRKPGEAEDEKEEGEIDECEEEASAKPPRNEKEEEPTTESRERESSAAPEAKKSAEEEDNEEEEEEREEREELFTPEPGENEMLLTPDDEEDASTAGRLKPGEEGESAKKKRREGQQASRTDGGESGPEVSMRRGAGARSRGAWMGDGEGRGGDEEDKTEEDGRGDAEEKRLFGPPGKHEGAAQGEGREDDEGVSPPVDEDVDPEEREEEEELQKQLQLAGASCVCKRSSSLMYGCRRVEIFKKLNKISEGTYGAVFRAMNRATGEIVALKQIKYHNRLWSEGFPVTSLREISIMLELQHPNVLDVQEVVVGTGQHQVFMVMEYIEHELKTLLDEKPEFSTAERKCLLYQLLEALAYMHANFVFHRDLKPSNLLYSNRGVLKVADFGMARKFGFPLHNRVFTKNVVTLWYRPPEILLGEGTYDAACDVWAVGAIFGEMLRKKPLFAGHGELDTLNSIFKLCGTPTEASWPEFFSLPHIKNKKFFNAPPQYQSSWREAFPPPSKHLAMGSSGVLTDLGLDLLQKLLELNPAKRITAAEALQHEYFQEKPRPQLKELMPTFPDTNNQARRKKRRLGSGNAFDEQKHQDSFRFGARVDAEKFLSALADQSKEKKEKKLGKGR